MRLSPLLGIALSVIAFCPVLASAEVAAHCTDAQLKASGRYIRSKLSPGSSAEVSAMLRLLRYCRRLDLIEPATVLSLLPNSGVELRTELLPVIRSKNMRTALPILYSQAESEDAEDLFWRSRTEQLIGTLESFCTVPRPPVLAMSRIDRPCEDAPQFASSLNPREQTVAFLTEKLKALGLAPREYNEFIVYWFPLMQKNAFNHVYFAGGAYTDSAKLEISPKPDTVLRVFMLYQAASGPKSLRPQTLQSPQRNGFTVVEWGGAELEQASYSKRTIVVSAAVQSAAGRSIAFVAQTGHSLVILPTFRPQAL